MRFLLVISVVLLSACGRDALPTRAASPASPAPPIPVQATPAATQQWPDVYEATGTVRARTSAVLASKVMAYVGQVAFQAGDRVRQGQLLVTLDSQELDAGVRRAEAAEGEVLSAIPEAENAIAAAQANLDLAESTFRRMEELAAKKSISTQEFDEASARRKSAVAAHEMARARRIQLDSKLTQVRQDIRTAKVMREYTRIVAPFAGVVTAKSVETGTLAAPGAPLLTLEREGAWRLEASVEESKLPFVKPGQAVDVSLDALDRRVHARVSEIVPSVDAASRAYIVRIDLPSVADLRSGMFGRAAFTLGTRQALAIPAPAVIERGQLQSVFAVEDGFARTRLVTIGKRTANAVEVLSGLNENEKVVSPVPSGLSDGARVEVRP